MGWRKIEGMRRLPIATNQETNKLSKYKILVEWSRSSNKARNS